MGHFNGGGPWMGHKPHNHTVMCTLVPRVRPNRARSSSFVPARLGVPAVGYGRLLKLWQTTPRNNFARDTSPAPGMLIFRDMAQVNL